MSLELEVYRPTAPSVRVDVLPDRMEPSFLEEVRGPGAGSFKLSIHDKKIVKRPDLIDYGNIIKARVDGKVVSAFVIQNKHKIYVDEKEKVAETEAISGEGLRTWLTSATLYPFGGLRQYSYDDRTFSFASEKGTWYVPAEWKSATRVMKYLQAGNPWGTAPAEWPDVPDAYWIWDRNASVTAPLGFCYFRYEFDLTEKTNIAVFFAGDNDFEVYVDAQQVIETRTETWQATFRADMELDAGHHIVAVRVENKGGPAGLLGAIRKFGDVNVPTSATTITRTGDAGWVVNPYPVTEPGWTVGEILLTIMQEAEDRGVRFPATLVPTFTHTHDSNGAAWDTPRAWTFDIGTEYAEIVNKLEELSCDIWIDPDTYELHAAKDRGRDRSMQTETEQPVTLRIGKNLLSAYEAGQANVKNVFLLKTAEGWVVKEDTEVATSPFGRMEGQLSTDLGMTLSNDVALAAFEQRSKPETTANFGFIPTKDVVPFRKFNVGDWLLAPGETGLEPRRVVSIAAKEKSDTGEVEYAVEFDTIFKDRVDRLERWLENLSSGAGGGGTMSNISLGGAGSSMGGGRTSTPGNSSGGGGGTGGGTIPLAPTTLQGTSRGLWRGDGSAYAAADLKWAPTLQDTTGQQVTPSHYEVWGRMNRTLQERTVINRHPNPGFENGLSGVVAKNSAASQSTAWSKYGTYSLRLTPNTTSTDSSALLDAGVSGIRSGMQAGGTFTASAFLNISTAYSGAESPAARTLSIVYTKADSSVVTVYSAQAPNVAGQHLLTVTTTLPAGILTANLQITNGSNSANPRDTYWDAIMVTEGSTYVPYFDGSFADDDGHDYGWTGAAGLSSATMVLTDKNYRLAAVRGTSAGVEPLEPETNWFFSVVAVTAEGNRSAASAEVPLSLPAPQNTLPAPSKPSGMSKMGYVHITWDGLLGGASPAPQFDYVYIGMSSSTSGTFTPVGQQLTHEGSATITGFENGDTHFFKLFAVDRSGRVSAGSEAVSVVVTEGTTPGDPEVPSRLSYGRVEPYYTSGRVYVQLDGSSEYTGPYPVVGENYTPQPNDTVALQRDLSGSYVILGAVKETPKLPNKLSLPLQNGWTQYDAPGTAWKHSWFTKADGIVVVGGLIANGSRTVGTTLAVLPPGFRPDTDMAFAANNADTAKVLIVKASGEIQLRVNFIVGFISLDNIAFPAAGVASWIEVDPQGTAGSDHAFQNGWRDLGDPLYGKPRFWQDFYGMVWFAGMVSAGPGAVTASDTVIFQMPPALRTRQQTHSLTCSYDAFGFLSAMPASGVAYKTGNTGAGWVSLAGLVYPATVGGPTFTALPYRNSWRTYSAAFPIQSYWRSPAGLVHMQGFITGGGFGPPSGTMPAGHIGTSGASALRQAVSGDNRARLDINQGGEVIPLQGQASWYSLDSMVFVAAG